MPLGIITVDVSGIRTNIRFGEMYRAFFWSRKTFLHSIKVCINTGSVSQIEFRCDEHCTWYCMNSGVQSLSYIYAVCFNLIISLQGKFKMHFVYSDNKDRILMTKRGLVHPKSGNNQPTHSKHTGWHNGRRTRYLKMRSRNT